MASWGLTEAKAKFSEVVDRAVNHEPQEILRNGKPVAVMVSMDDWMKEVGERPDGTLVDFFFRLSFEPSTRPPWSGACHITTS